MTYLNAPIREAIFDIRVSKFENKSVEDFDKIYDYIKAKYPEKRIINELEGTFSIGGETTEMPKTKSSFKGIIFSEKQNGKKRVQFRTDGFSLNYLAPYSNWDNFKKELKELWEIYVNEFPDIKVERIALRYINRINIPLPFEEFDEYVHNIPPIPHVLPQVIKSFFSQIEVPCGDSDYSTIISSTIDIEQSTESILAYILDIDVYKLVSGNFDFEDFDKIREIKNKIFESSITDKTRNLFK